MMLDARDKKALSDIRMAKAQEFLDDAKATLEDGRYKTCINRSYYAALSAARALLILEGSNPQSHDGVVTMLSLRFVKPELLPIDAIKRFKVLLSRRTEVDYGDFQTIDSAEAEDSVRVAGELIEQLEAVRQQMLQSL